MTDDKVIIIAKKSDSILFFILIAILLASRPAQIGMIACWQAAAFLVRIGFEGEAHYNAR